MRIVQLVTRRQRRGGEVVAAELSTELARRGHELHFAGLAPPPEAPLAPDGAISADVSEAPAALLSLRAVRDLAAYLKRVRPDVVQANGGYSMKYLALASRWARASWPILYCNIGLSSDWLRRPGQRAWNGWLLGHADVTAAVSAASREDLLRTYGLDATSVEVVRRGVALDAMDRETSRHRLLTAIGASGGAVVLHVGSFAPEKNHAGLIRSFQAAAAEAPEAHLVLVGDGPERAAIEPLAQADARIHLLGLRDDVPTLMAGADLLALPSLTEGIPGVILEAGAQSLPTIAYDVGGVSEAVLDGETGVVVSAGDEAGFSRALASLLTDGARRTEMGAAARAFVAREYSLSRSVDLFEALYHRILPS